MNTKAKGSRKERQIRDILQDAGYEVSKAGGSLGVWDLIAVGKTDVLGVQVKSNNWPGRAEMLRIAAANGPPGFRKLVVRIPDRQQPQWRPVQCELPSFLTSTSLTTTKPPTT